MRIGTDIVKHTSAVVIMMIKWVAIALVLAVSIVPIEVMELRISVKSNLIV